MVKLVLPIFVAAIAVAIGLAVMGPTQSADAYNTRDCPNGKHLRWPGQAATYDRSNGGFPVWWQEEIDEAADIWNDDGGANFSFRHSTSSSHDWGSKRLNKISRVAETTPDLESLSDCTLTDMDTFFNTRYTFNRCDTDPGDCNQWNTYDVKAVALHEFGHWFLLEHTQWWRFGCVMRRGEAEDRTLCNDDKNGMQGIYGARTS